MGYKIQMKQKLIKCVKLTVLTIAASLIFDGKQVLASPVVLDSMSVIIYEDMTENSMPIGNLVQGNAFELNGSIVSEDGQSWYEISVNGLQGYIMGDAVLVPMEQDTASVDESVSDGEREVTEEAADEDANNENRETDEQENTEIEENGEEPVTGEQVHMTLGMQENKQKKTYGLAVNTEKIKKDIKNVSNENAVEPVSIPFIRKMDKAVLVLAIVIVSSAIMACFSIKAMVRLYVGLNGEAETARKSWWELRKTKKRKKIKQNKKKQQLAKEAKRWKNNNIQK